MGVNSNYIVLRYFESPEVLKLNFVNNLISAVAEEIFGCGEVVSTCQGNRTHLSFPAQLIRLIWVCWGTEIESQPALHLGQTEYVTSQTIGMAECFFQILYKRCAYWYLFLKFNWKQQYILCQYTSWVMHCTKPLPEQFWLIVTDIFWIWHESGFTVNNQTIYPWSEQIPISLQPHLRRANNLLIYWGHTNSFYSIWCITYIIHRWFSDTSQTITIPQ